NTQKNQKIIDWHTVKSNQTFLEQVINHVACVVISDGDAIQTFGARGRDQDFRAGNAVSGKKRMRVQVNVKRHCERLWLCFANRYTSSSTRMPSTAGSF